MHLTRSNTTRFFEKLRKKTAANRAKLATGLAIAGFAAQAHAQSDPFTSTATTVETMLTGTFAKVFVVIVMVLAGAPIAMGQAGDHKGKLVGTVIGCVLVLAAQSVVTWLLP